VFYSLVYLTTEEFMSEQTNYECIDCGNTAQAAVDSDPVPECCGKPMQEQEPLRVCQAPAGAEHSRFDDLEEPCDDGRAGS
jgi:hypothetical protein